VIQLELNTCLSKLAPLIRESLLKAGVSNEFYDLASLPQFYKQAEIALKYGNENDSTKWCHKFQDIAMVYSAHQACQELEPCFICAPDLLRLKEYDKKNESDFYNTLKVYLQNNCNTALTSQNLYIHRSTLFYRLEKIKKLIELKLDNHDDVLYLRFSFYMMDYLSGSIVQDKEGVVK
jgi:sugar diacid utilization regulator